MLSFGFPPVSSPSAKVVILGSLPGRLSLERAEYYASPQNAFWNIVASNVRELSPDYPDRAAALIGKDIALWDVLAAATRSGSLDADIADDAIPNSFRAFFNVHAKIRLICFNGGTAARLYKRYVLTNLTEEQRAIEQHTLPSTSAANASLPFTKKLERWSIAFS